MKNQTTVRKTESSVKHFTQWLKSEPRFENHNILDIETEELDNYVGSVLLSICNDDGTDYIPDTVTSYNRSIARFLKENRYPCDMVTDKQFQTPRTILMSKRKELKQKGKPPSEEKLLAKKGCIRLACAKYNVASTHNAFQTSRRN